MLDNNPRHFYPRQTSNGTDSSGCLICSDTDINCNCAWNEICTVIARYEIRAHPPLSSALLIWTSSQCHTCPTITCSPNESLSGPSTSSARPKGLNKGDIAAAVVVPLVVFALALLAFLWYHRRRSRRLQQRDVSLCSTITEKRASKKWRLPHLPIASIYSSSSVGATKAETNTAYGQEQEQPAVRAKNPFTDQYNW
ncbi:hypothetical protein NUW54_g11013 [Trametes sanguinea]|uniref:Uncharacterized protein n=1 Tax=Trametes sanguinea TaxID=158606 RepID=A0ACC1NMR7_9APHY|nr:hypothetical protein NUW54_g11013 [Trametes sanguinea]